MTKYYVDQNGVYKGAWDVAEADEPTGFIEVPEGPSDAGQVWNGSEWGAIPVYFPTITARQLRLALLSIDLQEADVDMMLVNDPAGMVEWKYASYYKRDHPLIDTLGAAKDLLPAHIDSMWLWASEL